MRKIAIVDDNLAFADILCEELTRRGFWARATHTGADGLALVAREAPRLVLLDLRLPDMNGLEVLVQIRRASPDAHVAIVTGFPHLSSALAAIKGQVTDYLCKPFPLSELDGVLGRVFGRPAFGAVAEPATAGGAIEMVGTSEASLALRAIIRRLAAGGLRAVLITGESGTGKELVAGLLHAESARRDGPFIEVNCSAISETLFESELFGHERGAFTGAVGARRGLAEVADGGTLFLDEVGELPVGSQAKLLRFLDDQTFLRVGGTRKIRVDARIVAATNRDLMTMVSTGAFRGDLYYRLNVAPIALIPLRARPDDILPLAEYWLQRTCAEHGSRLIRLTPEVEELFLAYSWPGNVRELRNVVERMVALCPGDHITAGQLPLEMMGPAVDADPAPSAVVAAAHRPPQRALGPAAYGEDTPSLNELGHAHIRRVLAKVNGNKTRAAEILGISRQTLRSRLSASQ